MVNNLNRVRVATTGHKPNSGGIYVADTALITALKGKMNGKLEIVAEGGVEAFDYSRSQGIGWRPILKGIRIVPTSAGTLTHYLGLRNAPNRNEKFILTIHDLCSLYFDDENPLPSWLEEALQKTLRVIVPSHFTKREVINHLGFPSDNIHVVPNGPGLVDEKYFLEDIKNHQEILKNFTQIPYVVRVGGYTKRKNVDELLQIWPEVVHELPGIRLLMIGPPNFNHSSMNEAIMKLPGVTMLGQLSNVEVVHLVRSARALLFTSIYEGFGLPLVEAMKLGTPIIAKRTEFAKEICDDSALYFDNAIEISLLLGQLESDAQLRSKLITLGLERSKIYSWTRSAELLEDIYKELIAD